jgi:hypothetical protein
VVVVYAVLTCPSGKKEVVTDREPGAVMFTLNNLLADCGVELESITWIVKETVPDWLGVPLNCPVLAFRVNHDGNEEPAATDQVYGVVPPLAARRPE